MQATSAPAPAAPGQSSKEEMATATAVALPPPRGGGGAGGMASEANAVSSVAGTPLKAHVNPEFNGLINMFSPPARGRAGAVQSSSPPRGKPSKGRAMLDGSASPSRTPAPSTPASGAPRASQPTLESLRKLAGVSANKQATPTPVKANPRTTSRSQVQDRGQSAPPRGSRSESIEPTRIFRRRFTR